MANYEANEVINGTYGFVYDENGQEIQNVQEFEASVELEKAEVKQAGKLLTGHKVIGGKGKGSIKMLKVDSRLQKKIAENPNVKFNFQGKLADPTARGEEVVMLIGISFDKIPILSYKLGELAELELDFTFDDFRFTETID